jgi:hypothetical protein
MRIIFYVLLFVCQIFLALPIAAQDEIKPLPNDKESADTSNLGFYLKNAAWDAHARSFFMSTVNDGHLKDDYALAAGAGIGVLTKPLHGFQLGVTGFFIFNLWSSNLDEPEPSMGGINRYELGLFDMQNHTNKEDLDRLEELFLKYSRKKWSLSLGKMNLNTPFVNPQDGRMRPTVEEGLWTTFEPSKKWKVEGGWLWRISPRSTVKWFDLAESMGVYPSGLNEFGQRSNYAGNLKSEGMAIAHVAYAPKGKFNWNVWNYYVENIFNTTLLEGRFKHLTANGGTLYSGLQYVHQRTVGNGGNEDQSKAFTSIGAISNVVSAQLGYSRVGWNWNVNYTHITGDGRFLMPREWGRESFYTFMPRERNEGVGNVHAATSKLSFVSKNKQFKWALAYGYFLLPDVKNTRLNKYGLPSYHQINPEVSYAFKGFLEGMELRFLAAIKRNAGETYGDLRYVYNKVNMVNFNFIIDFRL